jgi:hypothetical protein
MIIDNLIEKSISSKTRGGKSDDSNNPLIHSLKKSERDTTLSNISALEFWFLSSAKLPKCYYIAKKNRDSKGFTSSVAP